MHNNTRNRNNHTNQLPTHQTHLNVQHNTPHAIHSNHIQHTKVAYTPIDNYTHTHTPNSHHHISEHHSHLTSGAHVRVVLHPTPLLTRHSHVNPPKAQIVYDCCISCHRNNIPCHHKH